MKEQELNTLMSVVSDPIENVYKIALNDINLQNLIKESYEKIRKLKKKYLVG